MNEYIIPLRNIHQLQIPAEPGLHLLVGSYYPPVNRRPLLGCLSRGFDAVHHQTAAEKDLSIGSFRIIYSDQLLLHGFKFLKAHLPQAKNGRGPTRLTGLDFLVSVKRSALSLRRYALRVQPKTQICGHKKKISRYVSGV